MKVVVGVIVGMVVGKVVVRKDGEAYWLSVD